MRKAGGITISPCGSDEIDRLQEFFDRQWRRGHVLARDRALLCWQYDPARMARGEWPGPTVLLARRGDEVVGMQCLIAARFNFQGRRADGVWLSNLLAAPEVRSQGVGLQLLMAVQAQGFDVVFDLGINADVGRVFRTLSYELIEDVPRWAAVVDVQQTSALLGAPSSVPAAAAPRCAGGIDVREHAGPLDPVWDQFWQEELAPRSIGTARDAAYLNWHYVHHPRFRYELQLARSVHGGETIGLAVWRLETVRGRDERVCRMVELLAATPAAGAALGAAVLRRAWAESAAFVDFYCSSSSVAESLSGIGFVRADAAGPLAGLPARFCPLEPGPFRMTAALWMSADLRREFGPLAGREDLYITKSDGDMDRPN